MVLGKRMWDFSRFISECTNRHKSFSGKGPDEKHDIEDSCSKMVVQLHDVYDPEKASVTTSFNCLILMLFQFI